ncbi:hypothetical protein A2U01_0111367, partial [Trifolium medium]|nr:hypothetical protein [Trifolium medium]
ARTAAEGKNRRCNAENPPENLQICAGTLHLCHSSKKNFTTKATPPK